jgi:hypothetical protein
MRREREGDEPRRKRGNVDLGNDGERSHRRRRNFRVVFWVGQRSRGGRDKICTTVVA